jgi:death on curing protein
MTFEWILKEAVLDVHTSCLKRSGGLFGVRDEGALESALARPVNKFNYGESDVFALAAAYGFGIAKDHPFTDGNKRTAFIATFMFLDRNGFEIEAAQDEVVAVMLVLAASEIAEEQFAAWLRGHTVKR